jgi:5-methylcytosine-specific restriction endonuclease McrA
MFTAAGIRTSETASSGAEVRTSETATSAAEVNNGRNESAHTSAAEVRTSETQASAPELEDRVQLGFTVTAETFERFEQAKAILSRKHPKGLSLEQAFEELLGFYLKHRGPRPKKRRKSASHAKPGAKRAIAPSNRTTRHIPAAIRREVFERDGHRCTYEGPTGRRCGSTHDLQLDHIHPWGCGGTNEAANLRVLCSTHNRHRNLTTKEPAPRYAGLDNQKCLAWTSAPEVNNGRTQPHPTSAPELPPDHAPAPAAEPAPAVAYLTRNQNPNGTSAPPITSHLPRPANPFLPRRMKIPLNGMNSSNTA